MESNVITVLSSLAIIIALIVLIIRLVQDYSNKTNTDVAYEGEFVGQIIDIFEDFLTEKKVNLYNADKQGEPDEAIIYGNDYDFLAKKIRELMDNWNVTYDIRSDK